MTMKFKLKESGGKEIYGKEGSLSSLYSTDIIKYLEVAGSLLDNHC